MSDMNNPADDNMGDDAIGFFYRQDVAGFQF